MPRRGLPECPEVQLMLWLREFGLPVPIEIWYRIVLFYTPPLRAMLIAVSADPDELDDLCQEVWVALFSAREQYRGGSFMAWLRTTAGRQCARAWRTNSRRRAGMRAVLAEWEGQDQPDHAELLMNGITLEELIGRLSDTDATIFRMVIEGYTHAEIGAELGLTAMACAQRFFRAIASLRKAEAGSGWSAG
jgi:RNA polymerase sigma factor (sigma-70 family)